MAAGSLGSVLSSDPPLVLQGHVNVKSNASLIDHKFDCCWLHHSASHLTSLVFTTTLYRRGPVFKPAAPSTPLVLVLDAACSSLTHSPSPSSRANHLPANTANNRQHTIAAAARPAGCFGEIIFGTSHGLYCSGHYMTSRFQPGLYDFVTDADLNAAHLKLSSQMCLIMPSSVYSDMHC